MKNRPGVSEGVSELVTVSVTISLATMRDRASIEETAEGLRVIAEGLSVDECAKIENTKVHAYMKTEKQPGVSQDVRKDHVKGTLEWEAFTDAYTVNALICEFRERLASFQAQQKAAGEIGEWARLTRWTVGGAE